MNLGLFPFFFLFVLVGLAEEIYDCFTVGISVWASENDSEKLSIFFCFFVGIIVRIFFLFPSFFVIFTNSLVGLIEGLEVGDPDGTKDGSKDGTSEGNNEGFAEGSQDGHTV